MDIYLKSELTVSDILPNKTYYYICLECYKGKPILLQMKKPSVKSITTHSVTKLDIELMMGNYSRWNNTLRRVDCGTDKVEYYISSGNNKSWKWLINRTYPDVSTHSSDKFSSLFSPSRSHIGAETSNISYNNSFFRETRNKTYLIFETKQEALKVSREIVLRNKEILSRTYDLVMRNMREVIERAGEQDMKKSTNISRTREDLDSLKIGDDIWLYKYDCWRKFYDIEDSSDTYFELNLAPKRYKIDSIDNLSSRFTVEELKGVFFRYYNNDRYVISWAKNEKQAWDEYNYIKYNRNQNLISPITWFIQTNDNWLRDIEKRLNIDLVL